MFLKKLINKGYEADHCEICLAPFKMIKFDRIHKCKRCNKFICLTCGDTKEHVIDEDGKRSVQKHRVCTKCRNDIEIIKQKMATYKMAWQTDSQFSLEWLSKLHAFRPKDYEYSHFLELFFRSGDRFSEETQIIDKDVIRGRTDFSVFNYSMKQFFYTVQQDVEDQHTTRVNIANVLYAVAARYDRVGYCQGMSGIAAFLLCFSKEEDAYIIFCDLIENIFPKMFFERNDFGVALIGLLAEIYFLKEYYIHYLTVVKGNLIARQRECIFKEDQLLHMKMIVELAGTKALLSIFIGVLNFTNLMFVWEELRENRSFEVIQRAFLAVIYLNRNKILEERSFKKLQEYFQKLDFQSFMETYHDIEIDQNMRTSLIEEFYTQSSQKWNSSGTGNAYTLSKVTNFTQNQIKLLQKAICQDFSNEQLISQAVVDEKQFMEMVSYYYLVLKRSGAEGESILQISPYFLKKIYCSYITAGRKGLLFRQFICCLSICTKSELKERICAIMMTFQDGQGAVSFQNFNKLMTSITALAPPIITLKKSLFLDRIARSFLKTGKINFAQLKILLNDEFINYMSQQIRSESKNIVEIMLEEYVANIKRQKEKVEVTTQQQQSVFPLQQKQKSLQIENTGHILEINKSESETKPTPQINLQ